MIGQFLQGPIQQTYLCPGQQAVPNPQTVLPQCPIGPTGWFQCTQIPHCPVGPTGILNCTQSPQQCGNTAWVGCTQAGCQAGAAGGGPGTMATVCTQIDCTGPTVSPYCQLSAPPNCPSVQPCVTMPFQCHTHPGQCPVSVPPHCPTVAPICPGGQAGAAGAGMQTIATVCTQIHCPPPTVFPQCGLSVPPHCPTVAPMC